jgi:hypothetical protein
LIEGDNWQPRIVWRGEQNTLRFNWVCSPGLSAALVPEFGFLFGRSIRLCIDSRIENASSSRLEIPPGLIQSWLLPFQALPVARRSFVLGDTASEPARDPHMSGALPVEIWRQILAAAVRPCVHAQRRQIMADDDHDPFSLNGPRLPHDNLGTNLAVCLVSKGFNSLATEFLYESVHFTSHERLNSAIQHSPWGGTSKFWWTKVLALRFWYTMDSAVPSVACLLSECVNLRLVVFAAPKSVPKYDLDQFRLVYRALPLSLQAICWKMGNPPIFQTIPAGILDNISQMSIESSTMMSTPPLTLPRVTYLRAKDLFAPTNLTFPSLRTVCMVVFWRTVELESSPFGRFIQRHAKQITTLQIDTGRNFTVVEFPVPLLNCCTNLTTLKYDPFTVCTRNRPLSSDTFQHTKLTHVFLFLSTPLGSVRPRLHLWASNYSWLSQFPELKHITVLRSCVLNERELSLILGSRPDPRLKPECGLSACT